MFIGSGVKGYIELHGAPYLAFFLVLACMAYCVVKVPVDEDAMGERLKAVNSGKNFFLLDSLPGLGWRLFHRVDFRSLFRGEPSPDPSQGNASPGTPAREVAMCRPGLHKDS